MTKWSEHVHRFAKKHKMTYREAQISRDCKEKYRRKKGKMSPKTSPRRKMNGWFGNFFKKPNQYENLIGEAKAKEDLSDDWVELNFKPGIQEKINFEKPEECKKYIIEVFNKIKQSCVYNKERNCSVEEIKEEFKQILYEFTKIMRSCKKYFNGNNNLKKKYFSVFNNYREEKDKKIIEMTTPPPISPKPTKTKSPLPPKPSKIMIAKNNLREKPKHNHQYHQYQQRYKSWQET